MVQIYYRTQEAFHRDPLAGFELGLDKDDYELVHTYSNEEAGSLEEIFRKMNVVDGDELPVQLKVRSMSVGDVVVDEAGVVWFCAMAGWEQSAW